MDSSKDSLYTDVHSKIGGVCGIFFYAKMSTRHRTSCPNLHSWQCKSELISAWLDWSFFHGDEGPLYFLWPALQAYRDMVSFSRSGTDPAGPTAGSSFYLMWTSRVGFQHQLNIWSSLPVGAGTDGACWLVMLDRQSWSEALIQTMLTSAAKLGVKVSS